MTKSLHNYCGFFEKKIQGSKKIAGYTGSWGEVKNGWQRLKSLVLISFRYKGRG